MALGINGTVITKLKEIKEKLCYRFMKSLLCLTVYQSINGVNSVKGAKRQTNFFYGLWYC